MILASRFGKVDSKNIWASGMCQLRNKTEFDTEREREGERERERERERKRWRERWREVLKAELCTFQ